MAAYSYMALVPIIQPPVIQLITTKKERMIRMPYKPKEVSKTTRILFPILHHRDRGHRRASQSVALVGFLMFGNLIRECGVLNSALRDVRRRCWPTWSRSSSGLPSRPGCRRSHFLSVETLLIMGLGLVAFVFDTVGGVLFAKFLNLFYQKEDQSHDRRGGHFRLSHVGARSA